MGQVAVNVNGRHYRFDCGDGEEQRFAELAAYVKTRIDALVQEYGNVGDDRLMLTAALLITDELLDARAELAELKPAESLLTSEAPAAPASTRPLGAVEQLDALRAEFRRKSGAGSEA